MIHASIQAIMPIVSLGTWKGCVNKFDPYVMYRGVYFFIFAFSGHKKAFVNILSTKYFCI